MFDERTREAAVRELFGSFCAAWTRGDTVEFGALFTDDADYVSYDGSWAAGRASLQDNHDRLFRGVLAGSAMVGEIESLRFVGDNTAVLVGNASVLMPWRSELPKRRLSRQIVTCIRTTDGWRIAAIQNGRQRPLTVPDPEAMPSKMSRCMTRLARHFGIGRGREISLP
ncbi:SgcJ/EcaC family oxidoreductase [Pseudactinotalea sp. HY158]|uniref:YybH family protein n=1 Tax=unclassified Pseudactinotalea TaxID=2649176 RepID=UPI00129C2509|nr:SgcJ/EcaC family oxidoreductase [Pseudactinotalea sp. HY158]MPV48743.1 SgcJ/EcaC family oxidoreductase [Pseudactinotalea sp. HY160]QGH68732.1 SgcJ/EcaC family oxidoreductase [Pseudactinotalea sp. HY158]